MGWAVLSRYHDVYGRTIGYNHSFSSEGPITTVVYIYWLVGEFRNEFVDYQILGYECFIDGVRYTDFILENLNIL
jgi:hypothetical protein